MAHRWPQGFDSASFHPSEFDHPELMDPAFIRDLDHLRMRCGFGLKVNDDARTDAELRALYAREIAKDEARGLPYGTSWPSDSAHAVVGDVLVRAADIEPTLPRDGDGCALSLEERELKLTYEIGRMKEDGRWKHLGLGIETGHWHVDDTPRLGAKRPAFWVAVSR